MAMTPEEKELRAIARFYKDAKMGMKILQELLSLSTKNKIRKENARPKLNR
jgi:hypothetical protein